MSDVIIGSREEFNLAEYLPEENDVADYEIAEKYLGFGNKIVIIKHGKKVPLLTVQTKKHSKLTPTRLNS